MSRWRWTGKRLGRIPTYVFWVIAALTCLVFLLSGLTMDGGFERAWEILLGIQSPFGQVSGLGVALSALGYIAVPAVIGLVVADGIARFTEAHLITDEEADERIKNRVDEKLREAEAAQVESGSSPKEDKG